ncbi:MAG: hypothetical protein C4K60_20775 [Ideonella sp. MAG2]|nr:MAG: hypothetical protein C4K60_20775 [Ideonella sp. MAG2]
MPQPTLRNTSSLNRRQVLASSAAAGLSMASQAQGLGQHAIEVEVKVQDVLHAANPLLVGSNTPWVYGSEGLMDHDGQWRDGPANRAKELAPTVLRYPGVPDTYHWKQGIGPAAQRKPVFTYPGQPFQKIFYGTIEFLEACEHVGAQPLIELNMHQGSDAELAQQAAEWVRFTNQQTHVSRLSGKPLPKVLYWELGNEPYVMERNHPLYLKTEHFARRVNAVLAAIKAVDPSIKVGLPFALDTYSGRPWRPNSEMATVVGEHLGWAKKMFDGIVMTQGGALFVADLLRMMAHEPQMELGAHWSLNGNWIFGAFEVLTQANPPPVRPAFHALKMFRRLLAGGHIVASQVKVDATQKATGISFSAPWPNMPLASAVAARQGKTVQVVVINKDPARAGAIKLSLPGVQVQSAQVEQAQAKALFDSPGQPEASTLVRPEVQVDAKRGTVQWQMGPASYGLATLTLA